MKELIQDLYEPYNEQPKTKTVDGITYMWKDSVWILVTKENLNDKKS